MILCLETLFDPQTTFLLLLHNGFYDDALQLSFHYEIDASPVFQRLTKEALELQNSAEKVENFLKSPSKYVLY